MTERDISITSFNSDTCCMIILSGGEALRIQYDSLHRLALIVGENVPIALKNGAQFFSRTEAISRIRDIINDRIDNGRWSEKISNTDDLGESLFAKSAFNYSN